ncbi:MAG TPA: aspartate/glutamate racemase family protein [Bacteroidales bacterium]|nr:aspartate/glutamate racemase family protein [Bacteroidales bacterium]
MKTIGLLGGTTWESTLDYYRIINQETMKRTCNRHTAKIVMYSLDFHDVEVLMNAGKMDELAILLGHAATAIERGGADCILVCANTMHMFADKIKAAVNLPMIHIAEVTLKEVQKNNFTKVGLLGTKPAMELDFYKNIFHENGVEIIIPDAEERNFIHGVIFKELFLGIINEDSRNKMTAIMEKLADDGAQGVILGCTEIPLLIKQEHTDIPVFDSTYIHSCAAVDFALNY